MANLKKQNFKGKIDTKQISRYWNNMTPEEKDFWNKVSQNDKARYNREMKEF